MTGERVVLCLVAFAGAAASNVHPRIPVAEIATCL